jgi:hypothetical protein
MSTARVVALDVEPIERLRERCHLHGDGLIVSIDHTARVREEDVELCGA